MGSNGNTQTISGFSESHNTRWTTPETFISADCGRAAAGKSTRTGPCRRTNEETACASKAAGTAFQTAGTAAGTEEPRQSGDPKTGPRRQDHCVLCQRSVADEGSGFDDQTIRGQRQGHSGWFERYIQDRPVLAGILCVRSALVEVSSGKPAGQSARSGRSTFVSYLGQPHSGTDSEPTPAHQRGPWAGTQGIQHRTRTYSLGQQQRLPIAEPDVPAGWCEVHSGRIQHVCSEQDGKERSSLFRTARKAYVAGGVIQRLREKLPHDSGRHQENDRQLYPGFCAGLFPQRGSIGRTVAGTER